MKYASMIVIMTAALALGGCQGTGSKMAQGFKDTRNYIAEKTGTDVPRDKLTGEDVRLADQTLQTALSKAGNNQSRSWSNKASGHSGRITPIKTMLTDKGYVCRDYKETLTIGDQSSTATKTACRADSGVWKLSS